MGKLHTRGRMIHRGSEDETPEEAVNRAVMTLVKAYPEEAPAEALARHYTKDQRDAWIASFTAREQEVLEYCWLFWARPDQREPDWDYSVFLLNAGRGYGKTRTAAETVRGWIESGQFRHIALIGANAKDLRRVIVEDVYTVGSGLLQVCPPWNRPRYSPTTMKLRWTNPDYKSYGASCTLYSGEEPDSLRGPGHDGAWIDEWAKMAKGKEVWEQLRMTMRTGDNNERIVISSTPQPVPFYREMVERAIAEGRDSGIHHVNRSTYDNIANLSEGFIKSIREEYGGTRYGEQEISAQMLTDVEGALWTMDLIDQCHDVGKIDWRNLTTKRVVGVDPQMSKTDHSMTGIVVAGSTPSEKGRRSHAYVLADRSVNGTPKEWARAAVKAYHEYDCQLMLIERNQGGEGLEAVVRSVDDAVRVKLITATRSKGDRAIPVVSRYEQRRVHHTERFVELEQEMMIYVPGEERRRKLLSPNRMDALVHAIDYLLVSARRAGVGIAISRPI